MYSNTEGIFEEKKRNWVYDEIFQVYTKCKFNKYSTKSINVLNDV